MLEFIKIIILLMIIVVCTLLGFKKSQIYENRLNELRNIKYGLEIFKSKIEFTYEPIKDIFLEISSIVYKNRKNIFDETIKNLQVHDVNFSWIESVENNENLNKEDKDIVKMFGKMLGKTDKTGQINEVMVTNKMIDSLIKNAEDEKSQNSKLFKTLGSVIGIGICIIFV